MENFIRVYDGVLSRDFCEDVIERFERAEDKRPGVAQTRDNEIILDKTHKDTIELVITDDPLWRGVEETLMKSYSEYVQRYINEFSSVLAVSPETYREVFYIKKYEVGGFFNWHIDCKGENFYRILAIQFYFNDVAVGGETEFRFQNMSVKPQCGRLIVFPTLWTYRHRGAPVVSNPKYVCTNFLRFDPDSVRGK